MYINTFKYTPKDVSCQLCTEYVKKLGCTALRCPWLAERIEAGVVGYREAVMETFPRDRRLSSRLNLLIKHYPGSLWSNEQHERRMQYQCAVQGYRRRRDTLPCHGGTMLFPISTVCHQPDKTRRPSAQGMAGVKCHWNLSCRNQSFHNILGIPKKPRKPEADAQPSRGLTSVLGFCGLSNLTKGVQSVPLVRNNPLRQFPVSLSATAALHHPQMVLVRMVPLSNLSNAGSMDF